MPPDAAAATVYQLLLELVLLRLSFASPLEKRCRIDVDARTTKRFGAVKSAPEKMRAGFGGPYDIRHLSPPMGEEVDLDLMKGMKAKET
jgi:hypothetical protein